MTATTTTTTSTSTGGTLAPLAEVLAAIDALLARHTALAAEASALRATLADLTSERRLREAQAILAIEGRNEAERQARLTLALAADADYRSLIDRGRAARRTLAEVEASAWACQVKVRTCLALLRLAGVEDEDEDGAEASAEVE